MQENNENVIKEFLVKLRENKELNERLQTKIISLKDVQNESKAKDVFLKELVSSAKSLGYSLEKSDFESYFNSQNAELSDDILEQASGGRGKFWSWLAVGLGTVAGGIGMIAGAFPGFGGLFGGGNSGSKNDTTNRPTYVQQIDANSNRSKSVERTAGNTGAGDQNKNADQKISDLSKNTGNRKISSGGHKKNFNLNKSGRSNAKGKSAVQKVEQDSNISATKAGEGLLKRAFSSANVDKKGAKKENKQEIKKENNKDNKKDNKAVKNIKKVVAEKKAKDAEAPAPKEIKKVDTENQKKLKELDEKTEEIKNKLTKLDEKISKSSGGWKDLSKVKEEDLNGFVENMKELEKIEKQVEKFKEDPGVKDKADELLASISGTLKNGDENSFGKKLEKISQYLKNKAPKEGKKEEKKDVKDIGGGLNEPEKIDKKVKEIKNNNAKGVEKEVNMLNGEKLKQLGERLKNDKKTVDAALQAFNNEKDNIKKVTEKFPVFEEASEKVIETLSNIIDTTRELGKEKKEENVKLAQEKLSYVNNLKQVRETVTKIKEEYKSKYNEALKNLNEEKAKVDKEKEDVDKTDINGIPINQLKGKITKSGEIAKKYEEIAKKAQKNLTDKIVSDFQATNGVKDDDITKLKQECEKLVKKYTNAIDTLVENEKKDNVVALSQAKIEEKLKDFEAKAKEAVEDISKEDGDFAKLYSEMKKAGEEYKNEENKENKNNKATQYIEAYEKVVEDLNKRKDSAEKYVDALDQAGKDKTNAEKLLKTVNNKIEEVEKSKITEDTIKDQEYAKLKKEYDEKLEVVEQKGKEIDEKIKEIEKIKVNSLEKAKEKLTKNNTLKSTIDTYNKTLVTDATKTLNEMEKLKPKEAGELKKVFKGLTDKKVEEYSKKAKSLYKEIFNEYTKAIDAKYKKDSDELYAIINNTENRIKNKPKIVTSYTYESLAEDADKILEIIKLKLEDYKSFESNCEYVSEEEKGALKKGIQIIENQIKYFDDISKKSHYNASYFEVEEKYNEYDFQGTLDKLGKEELDAAEAKKIFNNFNKKGVKDLYESAQNDLKNMKEEEKNQSKKGELLSKIVKEYEEIKSKYENIAALDQKAQEELKEKKDLVEKFIEEKLQKEKIVGILEEISSSEGDFSEASGKLTMLKNTNKKDKDYQKTLKTAEDTAKKAKKAAEDARRKLDTLIKEINSLEEKISKDKNLSENQQEEVKDTLKKHLQNLGKDTDVEKAFINATGTLANENINFFGATDIKTVEKALASNSNDDKYDLLKKISLKDLSKKVTKVETFTNSLEALRNRSGLDDSGFLEKNKKSFGVAKNFLKQLSELPKKAELTDVKFCTPKINETDVHKNAENYYKTVSDFLQGKKETDKHSKLINLLASDSMNKEVKAARENVLLGYLEKGTNKAEVEGYIYIYSQGINERKKEADVLYELLAIRDKAYSTQSEEKIKERDSAIKYLQTIKSKSESTWLEKSFADYILSTNGSLKMT